MLRLLPAIILLATLVAGGAVSAGYAQGNNLLSAYGGGRGYNGSILSGYGGGSGGSGDYRDALRNYGGSGRYSYANVGNGYTGAYAPKYSHYQRGGGGDITGFTGRFVGKFNAKWNGLGWNNGLGWRGGRMVAVAPPCGNFSRAAASCKNFTTAWDPSFQAQRSW